MIGITWQVSARAGLRLALTVGVLGGVTLPAAGVPLDAQACQQLQLRHDALREQGVEADMAMGPAAAKASLPPERLGRIAALIEVEELLNFRCGLAKLRTVLPTTIEGGEEEITLPSEAAVEGVSGTLPLPQRPPRAAKEAAAGQKDVVPAQATSRPRPKPRAKAPAKRPPAVAKAKENGTTDSTVTAPPRKPAVKRTAPKPRPRPKKNVDDAYRPPPKAAAGGSD